MARKTSKAKQSKASKAAEKLDGEIQESATDNSATEADYDAGGQAIEDVAIVVEEQSESEESDPWKDESAQDQDETNDNSDPVQVESSPASAPVVVRKGGFVPSILGGVVAAAIGFASALYLLPNLPESWLPAKENSDAELLERLASQSEALAALDGRLSKAEESGELTESIKANSIKASGLAEDVKALQGRVEVIGALEERLSTLEKAPIADATPEAVAAFKRELEALQAALADQRADVEAMAAAAEDKRASAEMTAKEAMKRSAVSQILTSLETGSGFADAVNALSASSVVVPNELSAQAEGVPSIASLKSSFPEPARAALTAARKADGGGGFGNFLKTQLGARSLEPREGDDPDAVLSRIEAAVADGRLGDALTEIEALPEAARTQLQGWSDAVKARQAAVTAAESLSQQINTN